MTKTVTEWEKILAKEIPNRGLLPKNTQKLKTQEENENPIEKKNRQKHLAPRKIYDGKLCI